MFNVKLFSQHEVIRFYKGFIIVYVLYIPTNKHDIYVLIYDNKPLITSFNNKIKLNDILYLLNQFYFALN